MRLADKRHWSRHAHYMCGWLNAGSTSTASVAVDDGLRAKYQAEAARCKRMESENAISKAKIANLTKENDALVGSVRLLESKVEFATEMARKAQAESMRVKAEETAKRLEDNERMSTIAGDVTGKIERFSAESKLTVEENERLRAQLEATTRAMDLMKQQNEAALRAKDLERQLAEAKQAQAEHITTQAEKMVREVLGCGLHLSFQERACVCCCTNERMSTVVSCCGCPHFSTVLPFFRRLQVVDMKSYVEAAAASEKAAKAEVQAYAGKFSEFQTVLDSTVKIIATYKSDYQTVRTFSRFFMWMCVCMHVVGPLWCA